MGAEVAVDGPVVQIDGKTPADLLADGVELNCANAQTAYWLLAGILAGQKFPLTLNGDVPSLVRASVVDMLTEMGAVIDSE